MTVSEVKLLSDDSRHTKVYFQKHRAHSLLLTTIPLIYVQKKKQITCIKPTLTVILQRHVQLTDRLVLVDDYQQGLHPDPLKAQVMRYLVLCLQ